jgi:hypothetical protein
MGYRPALALLDILRDEGVDRVFGNPGTTELPFLTALSQTDGPPSTSSAYTRASSSPWPTATPAAPAARPSSASD